MTGDSQNSENHSDEMIEYLQTFLDETEEQLDDLVETMLVLEQDSTNKDDLNEAFRLIHSIKGSAGMLGFDNIAVLTHHLENRFERFRSGAEQLNEPTINVVLRCIDYLRQCNNRLRDSKQLGSSSELLEELRLLEKQAEDQNTNRQTPTIDTLPGEESEGVSLHAARVTDEPNGSDDVIRLFVRFRAGLQLVDLKAQLITARLSRLGEVKYTHPNLEQLTEEDSLETFEIRLETDEDLELLRAALDVEGVDSIWFGDESSSEVIDKQKTTDQKVVADELAASQHGTELMDESILVASGSDLAASTGPDSSDEERVSVSSSTEDETDKLNVDSSLALEPSDPATLAGISTKVAETMRVEVDRLDHLMNLAGELVVNRARFVQISQQIRPELRQASLQKRIRDFTESLRRTIESLEFQTDENGEWYPELQQLRAGLNLMEEQSEILNDGRHSISQMSEAIDQLSRVSQSLHSGVLDARMVPVRPLFNRFTRVVRDLSKERGKQVRLVIRGEKTELDKRMIDQLGDPLMHLVRNSIDHGLERPEVRISRGKSEDGTIHLEASHSGNNVYICVCDDGGGIDVDKVKTKLLENQILTASAIEQLSDEQALDYIWHPGFSTAEEVTDVSGRGVGMDVVKTRINQMNGTIDIESTQHKGTTFTIRLPLTLAIINSLLVRLQSILFSIPIDDIREIVSLSRRDIVSVQGRQTFDVRGRYVPLVNIDNLFQWQDVDRYHETGGSKIGTATESDIINVVILHASGRTLGLRVDELLGSQEIVVKSLADNFVDIRGLSGASILGDGSVSLMLDVSTIIDLANQSSRTTEVQEVAN